MEWDGMRGGRSGLPHPLPEYNTMIASVVPLEVLLSYEDKWPIQSELIPIPLA